MEPSLPLGVWTGLPVQLVRAKAGGAVRVTVPEKVQPVPSVRV